MAVVAAVVATVAVEDKLKGRRPPTRDYGNERQRQETAGKVDWQR